MIKLDADKTMFLLVCKGHTHKEVSKPDGMGTTEYLRHVIRHRNGLPANYKVRESLIVEHLLPVAELVFTKHNYSRILSRLNRTAPGHSFDTRTDLLNILISELHNLQVRERSGDSDEYVDLFDTDTKHMNPPKHLPPWKPTGDFRKDCGARMPKC